MALALTGISLQLPSSDHRPSIPLERHVVRPGQQSQRRLHPLSLAPTACISLQLPSPRHRHSIDPLTPHVVRPVHLSPRRPRPLSISFSATAASAFSSASAAPPLTSRRSQSIQSLDELLETDGAGLNGGTSGGGVVGDHGGDSNRKAGLMVPPRDDWPPVDPETEDQAAIVPSSVGSSSSELEKFPLLRRLKGLKQRVLADDLFLERVAIESGLGIFNKNFIFKEPETVIADVAMALMSDFMLVHLPTPIASLTAALLSRFFHGCPDNAFPIAPLGSSYSLAQRLGAIALNCGKLFAVETASSMVRTAVRNASIDARNVAGKSSIGEVENFPILSTGLACCVYMAISDNLRCQVLDGVIDQQILGPMLHQHKLLLSAICFAVRTGNTFFGSLL